MAANIFVDPVIVATPDEATDRDGIVAWLENLALWLKEALSAHFTWLHSAKITELLEVNGRFPGFMNLRDLQRKYRLDINPTLLARNVNEFFRNPEFDLGNSLENLGVLTEIKDGSVTIQPAAMAAATIADEIKRIPGAKLHPLRISPAPNSPQRMRGKDQASAWRIDVMKYGAGWRLHYWHIPGPAGGSIEFSNVCKESDDMIYE